MPARRPRALALGAKRARAAFIACLPTSTSTYVRLPSRAAMPCFSRRLHTTGHFLQRGRDLQQDFLTLTVRRFFAM